MKKLILLISLLPLSWVNAAEKAHPNFVVIFTDDQGWGTTSVPYDPDIPESKSDFFQTPNIERLAPWWKWVYRDRDTPLAHWVSYPRYPRGWDRRKAE
jgi:hypothetical protein